MNAPIQARTVSVAVLNHRRPALLQRVLTAISQLDYPAFEIVVVGDQPGLESYNLPECLATQVRYVPFDEPNICRARNLAIRASGGEILAFIDDDATPEPNWLTELLMPFDDPKIAAVGGTVRASDGVSIEWQGGLFDRTGRETDITLTRDITTRTAQDQRASGNYLSLRGVNSAFRREALVQAGGFDEAIRYYLDETDMALRLADAGWSAAIARRAEVHHLLVPNATRGLLRMPGDQHEIGAGKAIFCQKHAADQVEQALADFRAHRTAMLDPQMRLGIVRMKDRHRVEQQLQQGITDGLSRTPTHPLDATAPSPDFQAFQHPSAASRVDIAIDTGWAATTNRALLGFAAALVEDGHRVSVFSFRSGPQALRVNFRDGMWLHSGGTWTLPSGGPSSRAIARHKRAKAERARIRSTRTFGVTLTTRNTDHSDASIELSRSRQKVTMLANDTRSADIAGIAAMLHSAAERSLSASGIPDNTLAGPPRNERSARAQAT